MTKMNIRKAETFTAVMRSGVSMTVEVVEDDYKAENGTSRYARISLEWANGEDVQDISETSYTVEDLRLIAHLFNTASDYRNEL